MLAIYVDTKVDLNKKPPLNKTNQPISNISLNYNPEI
jgi:hypothetical protein